MASYTYGQIQSRISDELHRSGLTTQIRRAIISAVEAYERQRFWFNEETATALTTIGQNTVDVPDDFVKEFYLQVTIGSSKHQLRPISYVDFLEYSAVSSSGQPTDYVYYADAFYLYPTPAAAYTLTVQYIKRLTELSADDDQNGWTNYCEELIRQRAIADLRCNQLRDKSALQEATVFAMRGEPYLSALEKSAHLRVLGENEEKLSGKVKSRYL